MADLEMSALFGLQLGKAPQSAGPPGQNQVL